MTVRRSTGESRFRPRANRLALLMDQVFDSLEDRNRAFDEALGVQRDQPSIREFPGPRAGCGHVRVIHWTAEATLGETA